MKALFLVAALALTGCGAAGFTTARQTVTTSLKIEGDVEDGILAAVQAEQSTLQAKVAAGAMSADAAQAEYDVFRSKVAKVVSALTLYNDAMKTAAHAIDASEAAKTKDYAGAMADVASAFASLVQALTDAGLKIPGVN